MEDQDKVSRAAGAVGSMTLLSRFFGFIRDLIIATMFGSTAAADAFFVAFRIPNIQRRILGEGAVSSAFVPVLSEYHVNKNEEENNQLASALFNILFVCLLVASLALYFFAPWLIQVFAPGFIDQPEKFQLTVELTQWMAPFLLFVGLASFCMGFLNTRKVFALPAGAPVLLNLSMISCALVLSPSMESPILGLAIGVVLGGLLQFLFQVPRTLREGFRPSLSFNWKHPGIIKIAKLMGPAILGLAVYEVNLLIDTIIASLLPDGSISFLYYANRLVQLPLGVFGVAIGIAILPTLSDHASRGNLGELRDTLAFGIRLVLFITIPATLGLIILRTPIIHTLWERGEFSAATTDGTAIALLYYSIGLCAFAGTKVVISAFYSLQDTKTPMKVGVWSMLLNIVLNLILMGPLQHGGLALATSLSALFNVVILIHLLRKRLGRMQGRNILNHVIKVFAAAILMGVLVYSFNSMLFHRGDSLLWNLVIVSGGIALGAYSFGLISHFMKIKELKVVLNLKKKMPA